MKQFTYTRDMYGFALFLDRLYGTYLFSKQNKSYGSERLRRGHPAWFYTPIRIALPRKLERNEKDTRVTRYPPRDCLTTT